VIAADRTHEEAHRVLMRCFAFQNRPDLVLKQHRDCRFLLRKDLGLDLSRETDELKERLTGNV
jgi:DNA-binding SARP family transcriptional activator